MKNKGFTLVELILVIVIIGIISAITIPGIMEALSESRQRGGENIEKILEENLRMYNKDYEEDLWCLEGANCPEDNIGCIDISVKEIFNFNPDIKMGDCAFANGEDKSLTIKKDGKNYTYHAHIICAKGLGLRDNNEVEQHVYTGDIDNINDYYKTEDINSCGTNPGYSDESQTPTDQEDHQGNQNETPIDNKDSQSSGTEQAPDENPSSSQETSENPESSQGPADTPEETSSQEQGSGGIILTPPSSDTILLNSTKKTLSLKATPLPYGTNNSISWKSSNATVATVSSTGVVTGKSPGKATITATTAIGGYTAQYNATVNKTVVIVIGASQVVRMKNNYTSHTGKNGTYTTGAKTLVYVAKSGTGISDQYKDLFTTAKSTITNYSNLKNYINFEVFFPLSGNTIKNFTCGTKTGGNGKISTSNSKIINYVNGYNNAIKGLKNSGYRVTGRVISMHPVKVSQRGNSTTIVTNENKNSCVYTYRSNRKYYKFNNAIRSVMADSSANILVYHSLFEKIMDVSKGENKNYSYRMPYNTTDGVHWNPDTAKKYTRMMLDAASTL